MHFIHAKTHNKKGNAMDIDWEGMKTLLAIARAGSLSGAARSLKLTQPTVGRRLDALEKATGVTLFQRTQTGYVPTDAGADLLAFAERMEAEALIATRRIVSKDMSLDGLLRLTSSDWFGQHVIAPKLTPFLQQHPALCIELLADTRWYSLERREADIAFRFVEFQSPDIVQRKFLQVDFALYASTAYLKRHGHPAKGDGTGHKLILMDVAFENMADVNWIRRMLPNAQATVRSNSREVQKTICRDGAGLAILPAMLAAGDKKLVPVQNLGSPPRRDVWLGYHRDLRDMPRLRTFVDYLTAAG
jgi:DNA-binding transcriptional LysR family regulator